MWVNKHPGFSSVREIVESNTGLSSEEILHPKRDPFLMNADLVLKKIDDQIRQGKQIRIVGDYDADGVMSVFILYLMILERQKELNLPRLEPLVRFPRRFSEGYGLSVAAVEETPDDTLLITVDNGIAAIEPVKTAKDRGLTVLIVDHHLPVKGGELPAADVICDPNALAGSEFNDYCAAGLSYRLAKMLVPNSTKLDAMLIAASVATVADVVRLQGDNRNIVVDGLAAANMRRGTVAFNMLFNACKLEHISEENYGYVIGPLFNAPGRLLDDGPSIVFNLLIKDPQITDPDYDVVISEIEEGIKKLMDLNESRKGLVSVFEDQAKNIIHEKGYDLRGKERLHKAVVLYLETDNENLREKQEGINGIIAGRIAEEYQMPCIVFSKKDDNVLKGSGRTANNVHLKNMLDAVSDCLLGYGGHAGAAGVAIHPDNVDKLQAALDEYLKDVDMDANLDVVYYDADVNADGISEIIDDVEKYAPYGEGNPPMLFCIHGFETSPKNGKFFNEMGKTKEHLRLYGRHADAVAFSMAERYRNDGCPKNINILGSVGYNWFAGKASNQINVQDYEFVPEKHETKEYRKLEDLLVF